MCFSPDGKFLASGSFDGTVKIWDPATGMEKQTLYGHTNKVIDVSFTPDSKYLASASDDWTVKIWEVATGREVRTLIGHVNSVCHTDFSPDGNYLASCAGDQMVKVWDLQTGKEVLSLPKGLARSAGRLGAPGEEVSVGHDARARTLLREKKWWEAEAASRKALAEQLDFAPAWQHLGFAYLGQGKLKGAVEAFRQAIRLQSKEALSYYGLGFALFELNRRGPATAVLLSLQGLANPGKFPEATRVWGEALALTRDDARLQNSIAWFLVATRDLAHRQPPEAVRLAQRAVQLAPKEGVYLNTLGVAHYRNGNLEKAIEVLTWSMELRQGGDPKDWFFLAMAHQQLKDPEQARKWYDKAVKWMDEKKTTNEDLRGFREEAEEILGKKAVRELLPPPRLEP
jgi:tetratricopeptide (TPR) repeat protein